MKRGRFGVVPIVAVVALLLVGIVGASLSVPTASPAPLPDLPVGSYPAVPNGTPRPTETPMGRYPRTGEATVEGSCVSGIDANTVPAAIAQAFCVCVLNTYETLYPTYDVFQQATTSGTITEQMKTDLSNRCVQQIVGG